VATAAPTGGDTGTAKCFVVTSHKVKVRCLTRMAEKPTSAAEVGREMGLTASGIAYHIRTLVELGLIEQVEERPVRGTVEHFFRTVDMSEISDGDYADLPSDLRRNWIETILALYSADAQFSLEGEVLLEHDDPHLSRTAMKVDREGWEDIKAVFAWAQRRVEAIKAESEIRLAEEEAEPPMYLLSYLSLFEMPPRGDDPYLETIGGSRE
jgi:predicted transcriptional regulator